MFDYTDSSGVNIEWLVDANGALSVKYEADETPVLDANKRYHLEHGNGMSKMGAMKHVARIPAIVYYKWLAEEGIDLLNPDHGGALRRKLNSNEYAYLRTGTGRVGKGAYD